MKKEACRSQKKGGWRLGLEPENHAYFPKIKVDQGRSMGGADSAFRVPRSAFEAFQPIPSGATPGYGAGILKLTPKPSINPIIHQSTYPAIPKNRDIAPQ
jgi:hypothetical protein